jgi:hypothetical protein
MSVPICLLAKIFFSIHTYCELYNNGIALGDLKITEQSLDVNELIYIL